MFVLLAGLFTLALWIGSTALIIKVDAARQRAAARARGEIDFMDRSLTPYLMLAFISGALPLVFYFGTTRKKASGWLLGLGAFMLSILAVGLVGALLFVGTNAAEHWSIHRGNLENFARAHAACSAPLSSQSRADDPCSASLTGVLFYTAYDNDADQELELKAYDEACQTQRIWACTYLEDYFAYRAYGYRGAGDPTAMRDAIASRRRRLCEGRGADPDCAPLARP